jgi:hypothetical protein
MVKAAAGIIASCKPASTVDTSLIDEAEPATSTYEYKPSTSSAAVAGTVDSAGHGKFRKRKKGCRPQPQSNTMEDGELFNRWMLSEIAKNTAKTELIVLQKEKLQLEIEKLRQEQLLINPSSIVFGCEL